LVGYDSDGETERPVATALPVVSVSRSVNPKGRLDFENLAKPQTSKKKKKKIIIARLNPPVSHIETIAPVPTPIISLPASSILGWLPPPTKVEEVEAPIVSTKPKKPLGYKLRVPGQAVDPKTDIADPTNSDNIDLNSFEDVSLSSADLPSEVDQDHLLGREQGPTMPPTAEFEYYPSAPDTNTPVPDDPQFARQLAFGNVEFVDVNASELHRRSTQEQIAADHFNEAKKQVEPTVEASFWNPRKGGVTTTLKPERLQKRKHQINQLAFQAKQQDMELTYKRAAGHQSKKQTMAKYGW